MRAGKVSRRAAEQQGLVEGGEVFWGWWLTWLGRFMRLDMDMVRGLVETNTLEELRVKYEAAVAEAEASLSDRVEVTGANMKESGTSGEFVRGDLRMKVKLYRKAIEMKTLGEGARRNRRMNHVDFSRTTTGW